VRRAHHVEVQILGDTHGNLVHLFERDCSVQRRNQKVVERAPAPYLDAAGRAGAVRSRRSRWAARWATPMPARSSSSMDADTGKFYFIEVNPRIQVEHTVTEQVTGIDIVKAQIRVTEGARSGAPGLARCRLQARHPLERPRACSAASPPKTPENGFTPDYGPHHRLPLSAAGFGLRSGRRHRATPGR
jgi:pyruvate carboxylase